MSVAYPIATRINRDAAAAVGNENDRFGGIGRNGAQHTPEATSGQLDGPDGSYSLEGGKIYNLIADGFIANHGAVKSQAMANSILNGIAAACGGGRGPDDDRVEGMMAARAERFV